MPKAMSPGEAKAKARNKDANIAKLRGKETNTMAAAEAVDPNKPLTEQQRLFVQFWAEGDTVPNAYAKAGYSMSDISYAFRMKRMPNILKQYKLVKAEFIKAAQVSREDVMNGLKDAIDMAKLMSEPATMIAGWREIGRLCGYYEAKKIDINVNVNGSVAMERMNKMTDAELLKIIEEASATGIDQALIGEGLDGDQSS
jgi:hypothetical protein